MNREGKHLLSHAAIYLVARGLPGAIAFLAIPLFTRLLAPADYGHYALVVATAALINALLFQWLRLSLVRYLPAERDPAALLSTLATLTLLLIAALGAVAAAVRFLPLGPAWRDAALPCWLLLAAQALFELACEYARSAMRPWFYMALQVTKAVSFIGLGALLVAAGLGWWGPMIGTAAGMGLGAALAGWRDWRGVRLRVHRHAFLRVLGYGLPLSITVALFMVIWSSDRFLIAAYLGEAAAGLYSAAVDFTGQTLMLLMMVIQMASFPVAVRAWERGGAEAVRGPMRTNAALLLAVGVPCATGMTVLAGAIAHGFLGPTYRAAGAALIPPIALGTFLAGLKGNHFDAAFQFAHRTVHQVWIVLVAAAVNVAANLYAIPAFGLGGAAAVAVLAYALSIALTIGVGRRHVALPFPAGAAARVLAAAALMAAALYPFRDCRGGPALAALITGGAAVYGAALLALDFLGLRGVLLRRWKARGAARAAARASGAREPAGGPAAVATLVEAG